LGRAFSRGEKENANFCADVEGIEDDDEYPRKPGAFLGVT
jgi:hypothetical protein